MSYQSDGANLYNQGYAMALQTSTTGQVSQASLISGALAIASGLDTPLVEQITRAVQNMEDGAAIGAQWGSLVPGGAGIGAIIGAVIGIIMTFGAHADTTDSRPPIVQLWDKIPAIATDFQTQQSAAAMRAFVQARYLNQEFPGQHGFGTCDDACANAAWSAFVNTWAQDPNVPPALALQFAIDDIGQFDIWTLRPCNQVQGLNIYGAGQCAPLPGQALHAPGDQVGGQAMGGGGDTAHGEAVNAFAFPDGLIWGAYAPYYPALLKWSDQQLYSFLIGVRLQIQKWEWSVPGVKGDPITDAFKAALEDQIGWVARRVPALQAQLQGGLLQLPHGLILSSTAVPAKKPLSTPAKVAVAAGGAGALALGAAAIVAWAKGESIGYVLKKAWKAVT